MSRFTFCLLDMHKSVNSFVSVLTSHGYVEQLCTLVVSLDTLLLIGIESRDTTSVTVVGMHAD